MIEYGDNKFNLCMIDVETSGRDPKKHAILELALGALGTRKGSQELIGVTDFLISEPPGFEVEPKALEINGLDIDTVLSDGRNPIVAVTDILGFFKASGFEHQIVLVGWNVGFDASFLRRLWSVAGRDAEFDKVFSYRAIDLASVAMSLNAAGHAVPVSSQDAFKFFGATPEPGQRHRARGDMLAALTVFEAMRHYFIGPKI